MEQFATVYLLMQVRDRFELLIQEPVDYRVVLEKIHIGQCLTYILVFEYLLIFLKLHHHTSFQDPKLKGDSLPPQIFACIWEREPTHAWTLEHNDFFFWKDMSFMCVLK